jgi:hypothetical protein
LGKVGAGWQLHGEQGLAGAMVAALVGLTEQGRGQLPFYRRRGQGSGLARGCACRMEAMCWQRSNGTAARDGDGVGGMVSRGPAGARGKL